MWSRLGSETSRKHLLLVLGEHIGHTLPPIADLVQPRAVRFARSRKPPSMSDRIVQVSIYLHALAGLFKPRGNGPGDNFERTSYTVEVIVVRVSDRGVSVFCSPGQSAGGLGPGY